MENKKNIFISTMHQVIKNYSEHEVGKNVAALSYYLLFTIFPLVIFVSNLLGIIDVNIGLTAEQLDNFMPHDVVLLLASYFEYVSEESSYRLLWFSLVFSIWFPMRASRGIMDSVRVAYHLRKPKDVKRYWFKQLLYTLLLLLLVIVCLTLTIIGKNILMFLISISSEEVIWIVDVLTGIWQYIRFILLGLLLYVILGGLYRLSLDDWRKRGSMFPGTIVAMVVWMIGSIIFSVYVERWADYSLIYGALGAMIVLLLWLYIAAFSIIIGIEFNAALEEVRGQEFQIRAEIEKLELKEKVDKIKRDIPAVFLALKERDTPLGTKILAGLTIIYALSPIDLVPDFVPIFGYLDDVILLPFMIGLTIKHIPKDVLERCREASDGMWNDEKSKKWYYAIPIIGVWILVVVVILKIVL